MKSILITLTLQEVNQILGEHVLNRFQLNGLKHCETIFVLDERGIVKELKVEVKDRFNKKILEDVDLGD